MTNNRIHLSWRKSQYSMGGNGDCVEVAPAGERVFVRDSKNPEGAVLAYNAESWRTFIREAKQA